METPFEIMYGGRTREEMAELIKSAADVIKGNSNRQNAIMKTMQDYETRCTAEQTRRAYELGAPIEGFDKKTITFYSPTTQQMIGWLREKRLLVNTHEHVRSIGSFYFSIKKDWSPILDVVGEFDTYEQAELASIDAALDYLEKGGTK